MRIIRAWAWSALALLLFSGVAWSFLVLFFQVVLSPLTHAERPLTAAFSPVHIGYESLSVSLPKPGIPPEANRPQSIGRRDLTQWLRPQEDLKAVTPVLDAVLAVEGIQPGFKFLREAILVRKGTDATLPDDSDTPRFVIVIIATPAYQAVLCSD